MPFCCHGYTKAVTQDLMDTFKAKSQKKGNRLRQQEEEEEDEEDVVDEVTLLITDSRSFFSRFRASDISHGRGATKFR